MIAFFAGAAIHFKSTVEDLEIRLEYGYKREIEFFEEIKRLQKKIENLEQELKGSKTNRKCKTTKVDSSYFHNVDSVEELKRQYRNLAKQYHPDITHDGGEMMKRINEEYKRIYKEYKENKQ